MDVFVKRIEQYDCKVIKDYIYNSMVKSHFLDNLNDKKVFIKLNCVGPFNYDLGITTHPLVLQCVLDVLMPITNDIIVGDNPAIKDLIPTLKKCGLYNIIQKYNVKIMDGTKLITINNSNAKTFSKFEVSEEMINVDALINLPKIKTHALAYMTCAEKNFFGLIYGLNKSAWHTKASNPLEFGNAVNDLYGAFLESFTEKKLFHIADGIIGLEGEGPSSGGITKKGNILISSCDAVAVDRIACEAVHLDYNKLYITKIASERGYGESDMNNIKIIGDQLECFNDIHFLAPKDSLSNIGLRFLQIKFVKNILLEHPLINKERCIKCGACSKICPPKTMTIKAHEYPKLKSINCIRCWCCAEVCPQNAISKSKRPLIGKIFL